MEFAYDETVERLTADLGLERGHAALETMNSPAGVHARDDGYVQDPSSQAVAAAVPVARGDLVLDVCAAPGGKATALASRGARVVAGDQRRGRAGLVMANKAALALDDLHVVQSDGTAPPHPDGSFDAVLVAYNTLFNLLDADTQRACFAGVAERLAPVGQFLIEAIVPDPEAPAGTSVNVRSIEADRVVLSISDHRPDEQRTEGQFVELSEAGGVRLRPWAIRWCTPSELDNMAEAAGLSLVSRAADMAGTAWNDDADTHVSTYARTTG